MQHRATPQYGRQTPTLAPALPLKPDLEQRKQVIYRRGIRHQLYSTVTHQSVWNPSPNVIHTCVFCVSCVELKSHLESLISGQQCHRCQPVLCVHSLSAPTPSRMSHKRNPNSHHTHHSACSGSPPSIPQRNDDHRPPPGHPRSLKKETGKGVTQDPLPGHSCCTMWVGAERCLAGRFGQLVAWLHLA